MARLDTILGTARCFCFKRWGISFAGWCVPYQYESYRTQLILALGVLTRRFELVAVVTNDSSNVPFYAASPFLNPGRLTVLDVCCGTLGKTFIMFPRQYIGTQIFT